MSYQRTRTLDSCLAWTSKYINEGDAHDGYRDGRNGLSPSTEKYMKKPKRAIVLRLDPSVLDRIDSVRHPLRMDRTTWLRKAVARNLAYNLEYELPMVANREIQMALMP